MAEKNYGIKFSSCRCEIGEDNSIWLVEYNPDGSSRYYNFTEQMKKFDGEWNINVKVSFTNGITQN